MPARVHFDSTLNWGHVGIMASIGLTLVSMLVAASVWWGQNGSAQAATDAKIKMFSALPETVTTHTWQIGALKEAFDKQTVKLDQIQASLSELQRDVAVIKSREGGRSIP